MSLQKIRDDAFRKWMDEKENDRLKRDVAGTLYQFCCVVEDLESISNDLKIGICVDDDSIERMLRITEGRLQSGWEMYSSLYLKYVSSPPSITK